MKYIANHTITVGRAMDERDIVAGEPLPTSFSKAEIDRLLALRAITPEGAPATAPPELFWQPDTN